MTLNSKPTYPTRRAYLLKLRCDALPDALTGRLENLVTGQRREFSSGPELIASIASELEASASVGLTQPVKDEPK
jgi:hypothetical protein